MWCSSGTASRSSTTRWRAVPSLATTRAWTASRAAHSAFTGMSTRRWSRKRPTSTPDAGRTTSSCSTRRPTKGRDTQRPSRTRLAPCTRPPRRGWSSMALASQDASAKEAAPPNGRLARRWRRPTRTGTHGPPKGTRSKYRQVFDRGGPRPLAQHRRTTGAAKDPAQGHRARTVADRGTRPPLPGRSSHGDRHQRPGSKSGPSRQPRRGRRDRRPGKPTDGPGQRAAARQDQRTHRLPRHPPPKAQGHATAPAGQGAHPTGAVPSDTAPAAGRWRPTRAVGASSRGCRPRRAPTWERRRQQSLTSLAPHRLQTRQLGRPRGSEP